MIASLIEELAAERHQRQLLFDISRTVQLERLLELLDGELSRTGLTDGFMVFAINERQDSLLCIHACMPAAFQGMQEVFRSLRVGLDEQRPLITAFRERRNLHLHTRELNLPTEPTRQDGGAALPDRLMILPLSSAENGVGALVVWLRGDIDDTTTRTLEQHATTFGSCIGNALRVRTLERGEQAVRDALRDQQRFLHFVSEINRLNAPEVICQAVVEEFLRSHHFDVGYVSLAEPAGLSVKHIGARPFAAERAARLRTLTPTHVPLEATAGASAFAFLQNNHVLIPDAEALRHLPMSPGDRVSLDVLQDVRTVLHMPIREHGRAIGMLGLFSLSTPRSVSQEDLKLIELVASFVGTALTNAHLYQLVQDQHTRIEQLNRELQDRVGRLDDLAHRDQLTGLPNYAAFRRELTRRTTRADLQPGQEALSLVVIDADHFKALNDTHGHLAGNEVLRQLARRLLECVRAPDVPCRFGGEEFVVILPQCDLPGALAFAERLRAAVAARPFVVEGETIPVTISAGCAQYRPGESADGLLERADAALYRAKDSGRDRVEAATAR